jgi:membrane protease YdiL (CAAX protease family)
MMGTALLPRQLRWPDAVAGYVLTLAGTFAVVAALHAHAIPGVVATYLAHAWLAAIALVWYVVLRRRFPIGSLDQRQLRPWYLLGLALVAVNLIGTLASPPAAGLRIPSTPTLIADLVYLAFFVGPTEEAVFRGLIQTALNCSIRAEIRLGALPVRVGTVVGALFFGAFHLVNLAYQPLAPTVLQAATAAVLGLVFGILYDRTRNLIGASLAHNLSDLSGTVIPLLAYVAISR